jgi:acyl-homoserine lactone acylase PvdQ
MPVKNPDLDYGNPVDGSDPATDWQGLHTVDEMITVFNPLNGWIQNCNSTPYTSAAENSPKMSDYPHYMSVNQENYRGVHAVKVLKDAKDLTLDKLIALGYDPYLPAFEVFIPGLVKAYDQHPDESLKVAIEVLRNWDFKVSKESIAMSLAHFYGLNYLQGETIPDTLNAMQRVEYIGNESPMEERVAVFKKTVDQLTNDFGSWRTQWGEINRYQRITGDIRQNFNDSLPSIAVGMASGNWGALASFGARAYDTKKIYGPSGNSFVAVVEFGDKVKAKSILAGGQNGDPDSPHFDDQAQRYADVKFKDVAYYREDVEKRSKSKYHPGEK